MICKKLAAHQSGYIGLLAILIGTALTLFLFMKMYFAQSPIPAGVQPASTRGTSPTTQYDNIISDINAAKTVSNQMNKKAAETNRLMNGVQ